MEQLKFDDLSLADKAFLINEFAHPLVSIEYYDYRIHLFSLNNHFVELFQNVGTRQIHKISIASYSDLDKYLSRILIGSFKKK
jgi:hypothetical protein